MDDQIELIAASRVGAALHREHHRRSQAILYGCTAEAQTCCIVKGLLYLAHITGQVKLIIHLPQPDDQVKHYYWLADISQKVKVIVLLPDISQKVKTILKRIIHTTDY